MTPEEYAHWAEATAGIPEHQALPPVTDDRAIVRDRPAAPYRCDPHRCERVCCTGWPDRGIRVHVMDLVRLAEAGLLDSVEGRYQVEPPDWPRLRAVDHHCVHYDPESRRCTIWEHRPLICRTYPFAITYTTASGGIGFGFETGCSLTPAGPAAPRRDPVRSTQVLSVRKPQPRTPARDLSPYERAHLEACVETLNEHERTWRLVTEAPDLLDALGLSAFRPLPEAEGTQAGWVPIFGEEPEPSA